MALTDKQIMFSFLREYQLIMKDFDQVLEYIDPDDENEDTFSHRTFELLLRTCTAFEAVSKRALKESDYQTQKLEKNWNIEDYFTLNASQKLSDYKVKFDSWRSGTKVLEPFKMWAGVIYSRLDWYDCQNDVKHDRDQNFKQANLRILMNAIAGLFVLLYSIYGVNVFGKYQKTQMDHSNEDDYIYSNDSIFSIRPPQ